MIERLVRAIHGGDVDAVDRLLREQPALARATIEWGDERKRNCSDFLHYLSDAPFHGFARHDRIGAMAKLGIAAGAPIEGGPETHETPLIAAASLGQVDVARALVDAGADLEATGIAVPGGTALAHAVHYGMTPVVDLLVAAGAEVMTLGEAAGAGRLDPNQVAAASEAERLEALRAAAVCDRPDAIDALLDSGLDVNAEVAGASVLHAAAWEGKAAAARRLLEHGANPAATDAEFGATPLGWSRFRQAEVGPGWGHDEVERVLAPVTH